MSLFQALVLLLFNTADKVMFTHIKEVTHISGFRNGPPFCADLNLLPSLFPPPLPSSFPLSPEDGELRRTMQSLALGKQGTGGRVLIKIPKVCYLSPSLFSSLPSSFLPFLPPFPFPSLPPSLLPPTLSPSPPSLLSSG